MWKNLFIAEGTLNWCEKFDAFSMFILKFYFMDKGCKANEKWHFRAKIKGLWVFIAPKIIKNIFLFNLFDKNVQRYI